MIAYSRSLSGSSFSRPTHNRLKKPPALKASDFAGLSLDERIAFVQHVLLHGATGTKVNRRITGRVLRPADMANAISGLPMEEILVNLADFTETASRRRLEMAALHA